ncbi:WYL domain-containing protein [Phytobacter diazotrophicus]|uniref:WYL domain-containing protein n=1 Tax=Phytobacter diazotrophicus TaxID=395631 RepID=UPI002FFA8F19
MDKVKFPFILEESQERAVRMAFIDFKIFFTGSLSRKDIIDEFKVSEITATRIISDYKDTMPENMTYDNKSKLFILNKDSFSHFFNFRAEDALDMLSSGFDKNKIIKDCGFLISENVGVNSSPISVDVVSKVTRAMYQKKKIICEYNSATSDDYDQRTLIPLSLLFDGINWIFRAYHENTGGVIKYKNFNFSRIISVKETEDGYDRVFGLDFDDLWNKVVPVELEINNDLSPEVKNKIKRDYGIITADNKILMSVRAAFVWIILNQLGFNYKGNGDLEEGYVFKLKNHDMLKQIGAI